MFVRDLCESAQVGVRPRPTADQQRADDAATYDRDMSLRLFDSEVAERLDCQQSDPGSFHLLYAR